MSVLKPFKRTFRPFLDGNYFAGGRSHYVRHPEFSKDPEHFVRAFSILQRDLFEIFDFIEPADRNLETYSFRIHGLLMRVCIEVEANCTAVLVENGYPKNPAHLSMTDYRMLEDTHRLSSYTVRFPNWDGVKEERRPFAGWASGSALPWYKAYNASKHDRHANFAQANFENLIDAISGLIALLSSQFGTYEFPSGLEALAAEGIRGPIGFESAIGGYLQVKFPDNWPSDDCYDFDWMTIKQTMNPIAKLTFNLDVI